MNPIFIAASNTILDASKNSGFGQFLQAVISYVCLAIDSIVYFVVTIAYKIFLALSQFELFNDGAFEYLINRAYIIIGVISLFLVAYSLLNAIINPENSAKGKNSVSKTVKNVVIAIIGVAIVPTLFNYFYYFQRVILCNNLIPRLVLEQVDTGTTNLNNAATELSELIFESFFYPNRLVSGDESTGSTAGNSSYEDDDVLSAASAIVINESNPEQDSDTYSLAEAYDNAKNGVSFWRSFSPFIFSNPGVSSNDIQYLIILSTIAGGYIAYVFINLCLDMGLRAVKLGYLELIAPLAIMTTIVPGQEGVFKNWSKKTISCAIEVFTRLFVVVFAVYLISTIKDVLKPSMSTTICGLELNPFLILIMRAIIYIAIFTFAKQAPKFFSEATGIKSDGFKLGLTDKMKESGILQGLGAVGGGITSGVRNGALGIAGFKNAQGGWNKIKAAVGGLNSTVAGTTSGMLRGWSNTKDVKKWSDVKDGAGKAADEAMEAKLKRDDYREKHKKNIPIFGGAIGSAAGHIGDAWDSVKDYPNAHKALYAHENERNKMLENVVNARKAVDDRAKKIRDDHAHEIEFKDFDGNTKTLQQIRKDEEIAQQELNAAIQAAANVKANGGDIDAANRAVELARTRYNDYHDWTVTTEKNALREIKSGTNIGNKISADELQDMTSLYNNYHRMLKDNISAIADKDTYEKLKEYADYDESSFRTNEIASDKAKPVTSHDENGTDYKTSVIGAIKLNAAKIASKMNQESEAVRKQQEKK